MTAFIFFFFLSQLMSCGPAPEIPRYNFKSESQGLVDLRTEKYFYPLPLRAELQQGDKFWSTHYWRLNKGMINFRWNSRRKESFNYPSPAREEVLTMLPEKLKALSPAEKLDILMGRYDYPIKKEVSASGLLKIDRTFFGSWAGHSTLWVILKAWKDS